MLVATSFAQTGTVSGTVVDDRTRQPVQAILVSVENQSAAGETDASGRFTLTVPRGRRTIIASLIGCLFMQAVTGQLAECATLLSHRSWMTSLGE